MKKICILLILFSGSVSFASEKLVDYRFGNQITGSALIILRDGTITHSERSCCPPSMDQIPEERLDENSLNNLVLLIIAASGASQSSFGAGQSGNGSSAGTLFAFKSNGKELNIRDIGFGDGVGGPQPVRFNTAPQSREIENFVFKRVLQKMNY